MLKKWSLVMAIMVAFLIVAVTGCGGKSGTDQKQQQDSQQQPSGKLQEVTKPMRLTLAGRSAGGVSQVIGETVGEAIKKKVPGTSYTYEPGQDGANSVTVATGKTELGLEHVLTASAAYLGKPPFDKKYENIRAISYLLPTTYHFVVDKRSGITSLEDIKNKKYPLKVAVNTKESVMELASRIVFKNYGFTYEDIEKWGGKVYYISVNQALDMMKDNRLDAISNVLLVPTSSITEAATTLDLDILPISNELGAKIAEELGGGVATIPKAAYSFLDKDVLTVEANNVLITSAEQPDNIIYTITKALHENQELVRQAHPSFKTFTTENMIKVGSLPLHPAAKKYYEEIGLIK